MFSTTASLQARESGEQIMAIKWQWSHTHICKMTLIWGFSIKMAVTVSVDGSAHRFPGSGESENKPKDTVTWLEPNSNTDKKSLHFYAL